MQTLADICIRRPVFASMIILSLVVVGATSYFRLGVDRLPSVDLPIITVSTTLAGASPEEIESEITQPIEEVINTVEGIIELRSISASGQSLVFVTFSLNRNIDVAAQDVRDRIAVVLKKLPREADPPIITKNDADQDPCLMIALSGVTNVRQLTELADKVVKEQLERSDGVGDVRIFGGLERTINVWADSHKLAALNLPITAVYDAIQRQNADVPGGNVTGARQEQVLRVMGRLADAKAFNEMVITTINGQPIKVKDIGYADDGTREQRTRARLNGVPTVELDVRRQSGANTIEVVEAAKKKLAQIQAQLPPGVKLEIIRDQSRYIYAALHEINTHLILGSIFASLVVLAFMRSWRSTVIAGVAIPASVIATFGMMWALHFTLNSVTMLALVLMVGVVIDDAIVVLENIFRFVEEKKMDSFSAARAATSEIALAVLATTLSLVVIFVPVSFMSSISGRFLYQFGITAAVAVMVSLLVSFTLTPMMSARLLRREGKTGNANGEAGHAHSIDPQTAPAMDRVEFVEKPARHRKSPAGVRSRVGFYSLLDRSYTAMLAFCMRYRLAVAVFALAVIASSVPLYRLVKQEFIPSDVDEAEFGLSFTGPAGASPAAMDDVLARLDTEVRSVPGVLEFLGTAGSHSWGGPNIGGGYVRIAPHEERTFSIARLWSETMRGHPLDAFRHNYSQRDVMQQVRAKLLKFPELRMSVRNFASFNIGGGNYDIDFVVKGPDMNVLADFTERLRLKCKEIGGIVDADITLKIDSPELRVQIDRARAADLGVNAEELGTALRLMVGGETQVSKFRDESTNEDYDVQLRLTEEDRNDPFTVDRLYLPRHTADGKPAGLVELANFARLKTVRTASRIDRLDRQRSANLRAGVAPGFALADRLEALQNAASEMGLPQGYTTGIAGRGRELARTFDEFVWAFLLSIVFMYIILAMNYESLIHPLTILLSLPLTVPFALLSLWATGSTLNLYSALGILVLFGVVKKNSILQIDHMNQLRATGMPRLPAILEANRDRLRPILMTTLALVAGMLPLAVGTGPGAEERHAVAVVVIGGQTLSLLLTLLVTPVAYSLFDDLGALIRKARARRRPLPAAGNGAAADRTVDRPAQAKETGFIAKR